MAYNELLATEVLVSSNLLTPSEAKIYLALVELKESSIEAITNKSGVHRRNAYDALQCLIAKGLVYQVLPKKVLTFAPSHPDKLQELANDRIKDVEDILPSLKSKFSEKSASQSVYIFKGVGGLKNYINLILETSEDIYGINSKGTWFDPRIKTFAVRAGQEVVKKKIKSHLIYDWQIKEHPEVIKAVGKPYKFLPQKYSNDSSIDIFGEYVAIYSGINVNALDQDITIFILKDKTLARDYKQWFDFMWDVLPNEKI
ncbi:MAG: Transcriptional regulator TrmB [Parcubacteria group bacterium Licking1014_17]|nr:MAG: Transcriptional regulator TrmB [Parcubacteria group bacterium Licking1014_17]